MSDLQENSDVLAHYGNGELVSKVQAALEMAQLNKVDLNLEELEPLDQFHAGGRTSTAQLGESLRLTRGGQVLDIGSGLGGPARFIADKYDCAVYGVDLSPQFVEVAKFLSTKAKFKGNTEFRTANALDLPFEKEKFDAAYTQHVAMNIENRDGLYAEIYRVLKPGSFFTSFDVMSGENSPVAYPTPWSRTEASSFLLSEKQMQDSLTRQGFTLISTDDKSELALRWFEQALQQQASGALSAQFGLPVVMGPEFPGMARNFAKNLKEKRISLVQTVVRKV